MRRIALAVIAVSGIITLPATSAFAAPTPAATLPVPAATPGQAVCALNEDLTTIVGLTATASGYAVVNRATDGGQSLQLRVYQMTGSCKLTTPITYGGTVHDPRDIQVSADGSTYWVTDSGDDLKSPQRSSIGLWKVPVNKAKSTQFRFAFPDGDGPFDVDALLMNGDGTPVFVTHPLSGPAGIYVPAGAMNSSGQPVPLRKAGQFTPQQTDTANTLGAGGRLSVTGAANSPDGKKVVLRTYSDAYEWDVAGGDVVKALTTGTPRITPLPGEPLGEAITYSHDGKYFLTVSDVDNQATILRYTPAVPPPPVKAPPAAGGAKDTRSWFSKLSKNQLTALVGSVGVIGLLMVAAGVIGIMQVRKRDAIAAKAGKKRNRAGDDDWAQDEEPLPASAMAAAPGGRYQRGGDRYESDRYESERHPGAQPPPGRVGRPRDAGYGTRGGGPGEPPVQRGRAPQGPPPGGTYRGGGQGGQYEGGGTYSSGGGGRTYGEGGGGGTYSSGGSPGPSGKGGGTYSGGGYQPSPPPVPPRTDGGIARSHRPESRRPARGNEPPPRRGYSDEHDGFDDLRRLSE